MKTKLHILAFLIVVLLLTFSLVACQTDGTGNTPTDGTTDGTTDVTPSLWDGATYRESVTLGDGTHTLALTVEMEGKSIVITVKTDETTVKDALAAHGLIDGEQQAIGYLMSHLNGVRADWTLDGAYWAFYQNGKYMMSGIDSTPIEGDAAYEFVYTKA